MFLFLNDSYRDYATPEIHLFEIELLQKKMILGVTPSGGKKTPSIRKAVSFTSTDSNL
jgi:hypothetical protein